MWDVLSTAPLPLAWQMQLIEYMSQHPQEPPRLGLSDTLILILPALQVFTGVCLTTGKKVKHIKEGKRSHPVTMETEHPASCLWLPGCEGCCLAWAGMAKGRP